MSSPTATLSESPITAATAPVGLWSSCSSATSAERAEPTTVAVITHHLRTQLQFYQPTVQDAQPSALSHRWKCELPDPNPLRLTNPCCGNGASPFSSVLTTTTAC